MNTTDTGTAISHEQVSARARELWQRAGNPSGRDEEFWLAAEHELGLERADSQATRNGQIDTPPRSTPDGGNPAGGRSAVDSRKGRARTKQGG